MENIEGDLLGKDDLFDLLVACFSNVRSVMDDRASIYVTAPQGGDLGLMMLLMMWSAGLPVRHVLNWVKNQPTFSLGRLDYEYQHEPIFYTWKKTHKYFGAGKYHTSTWFIDRPREAKLHPTMKPVELVENALMNSTTKKWVVLDPFIGSGTTMIACENLNRYCRGIDLEPINVAITLQRYEDAFGIHAERVE